MNACYQANTYLDNEETGYRFTRACTLELRDTFYVAGYGSWQGWKTNKEKFYDTNLNAGGKLLRGLNRINEFRDNSIYL